MPIYNKPKYYDIAFGFMDIQKQVDLFERFAKRFSRIRVRSVLDIGCGPGLQLIELARRGYNALGLDASQQMLEYLKKGAQEKGVTVHTVNHDMRHFQLKKEVDFAFIMMGTITYMRSNADFLSHLDSVAASLRSGGLYLIEDMRLDWSNQTLFEPQKWTREEDGVSVKTTYSLKSVDTLSQLLEETIRLEVNDSGRRFTLEDRAITKQIFPQELLELLRENGKFEFIGWFERERVRRLEKADKDNIVILRKR